MASAALRVFAIPELHEHILVHLDEPTLLQTTAVSKAFVNLINTSQKIKQRLWLQPYKKVFAYPFSGFFVPEIHFNHLLLDQHEVAEDNPARPTMLLTDQGLIKIQYAAKLGFQRVAQSASCRDMLLFHPPVKCVQVSIGYQPHPDTSEDECLGMKINHDWYMAHEMLQNEDGVRFGQILKVIESLGLDRKVEIHCDFYVRFGEDDSDGQSECDWVASYPEEKYVPKKRLVEVMVDNEKLAKIDATVNVTQTKDLIPATFAPPASVTAGIFGNS